MTAQSQVPDEHAPTRSTRRYQRNESQRLRRIVTLAPLRQLAPGLSQLQLGKRRVGVVGLISAGIGALGVVALVLGFVVDRRIGLGWATQERPLTIILVVAAALGLVWFATGIHLAVTMWRDEPDGTHRPWISALVIVVAFTQLITTGAIAYYANVQREFISDLFPSTPPTAAAPIADDALTVPLPPPRDPVVSGRVNILVLGGDAGPGRWGLRPDSISVVSIDLASAETTIIGIPRNLQKAPFAEDSPLWGPFPNGYNCGASCLISYLYTYASGRPQLYPDSPQPGVEATRDAVEGVLGIDIPYAVLMDMQGFQDLIDAIDGVDVCIPKTIYADDKRTVLVEAGCQHLDGETALTYARARHDSDDYGRMAKQRMIQQALLEQADPLTVLQNFQELTDAGSKYIYTDIPQDGIGVLLDAALRARGTPAKTIELVPPRISSVNPPFDSIHRIVKRAFE